MTQRELMCQVLLVCSQDRLPSVEDLASKIPDAEYEAVEERVKHAFGQGWLSARKHRPSMMDQGGEVILSQIGLTSAGCDALNKLRRTLFSSRVSG